MTESSEPLWIEEVFYRASKNMAIYRNIQTVADLILVLNPYSRIWTDKERAVINELQRIEDKHESKITSKNRGTGESA
jgi:hypothetical protein